MNPDEGGGLDAYGWQRHLAECKVEPMLDAGFELARVRRVDRGECDVATSRGDLRVLSDSTRSQSDRAPATGDWVLVEATGAGAPRIHRVLPRRTAIVRRDPSEAVIEQVLVANVDVVGVVVGVDRPVSIARIERFLVLAEDSGATPIVVCTKADLGLDEGWVRLQDSLGDVEVIVTSAVTGEGIEDLRHLLADNRTLVLLGESGSGKSTLVNALVGDDVQRTSAVRSRDSKGRHTTTARELVIVTGGGILIDTPGVRGVGLWDADGAVDRVFSDIGELASSCRFGNCAHGIEPDCEVRGAVADGRLDGRRLDRYLRLVHELDEQAGRREDQRRRARGRRRY